MIGTKRLGIVILATLLVVGVLVAVSPGVIQADDPTPTDLPTLTASPTPTATLTILPTATVTILPTATLTIPPTPTLSPTATQTTLSALIDCSPRRFDFIATAGTNPESEVLYIWNAGAGTMNWSANIYSSWLNLIPPYGQLISTGQPVSAILSVDIYGLDPGNYSERIPISSSQASNSPQWVWVYLKVIPKGGSVAPNVSATATATEPVTTTPTSTPTATPPPGEGGGVPPWVWPVVGVLAVICAALAGFALVTTGVLGKLGKIGKGGAAGAGGEDVYEGGGDSGGDTGDYNDEV